ncbi:MAG: coproporphyrinogen III oxidase family protein [Anaerolineaceae bacterium]|nr:coproporphyrinogen III oxidase family protein [Anaerolineaceae bacterium]
MIKELYNTRQKISSTILSQVIDKITYKQLQLDSIPRDFQYPSPIPGHEYVLYAHIPFCESLCPYCSFNRFIFNEGKLKSYYRSLRREMEMLADLGYDFVNLYIGGGTPTVDLSELTGMIDFAKNLFSIKEVSCETNPNHLSKEILGELKGRVDRLSVGVQSFDDKLLRQMSRYEKFGSGDQILEIIQNAVGILPSLNIDMIYNLPDQTEESLMRDLEYINKSGAEQTTFYPLMSAPSVKKAMEKTLGYLDHAREFKYFQIISEKLSEVYKPSSGWTFSRKDLSMLDEYIVQYEEYVGTGSGSFSYLDGNLLVNTFSLRQYEEKIKSGFFPVYKIRQFSNYDKKRYRFLMEMFDLSLNTEKFQKDFKVPLVIGLFPEMMFMWLSGAFGKWENGRIYLRPESRYLLVVMMREFFSNVNILRDQARSTLSKEERLMCVVNEKLYHNEFV